MTDRPLTAREVADMLGIHINTAKRIPFDELPYFRVSSRGDRRYRLIDVKLYMNNSVKQWTTTNRPAAVR